MQPLCARREGPPARWRRRARRVEWAAIVRARFRVGVGTRVNVVCARPSSGSGSGPKPAKGDLATSWSPGGSAGSPRGPAGSLGKPAGFLGAVALVEGRSLGGPTSLPDRHVGWPSDAALIIWMAVSSALSIRAACRSSSCRHSHQPSLAKQSAMIWHQTSWPAHAQPKSATY